METRCIDARGITLCGSFALLFFACGGAPASPDKTVTTGDALHNQQGGGGDAEAPPPACQSASPTPTSCSDWKWNVGDVSDGCHVIDPDGAGGADAFEVYCQGMDSYSPREYVELDAATNLSTFAGGGACACDDDTIAFDKVRLDLLTMSIDGNDRRFASSSGACVASHAACAIALTRAYGEAASCLGAGDASGSARIDLTGTSLHVALASFGASGAFAAGSASISSDRKVVVVTGGGACGSYGAIGGRLAIAVDGS